MALDPDRRASLLGAKLGALVTNRWPDSEGPDAERRAPDETGSFAGGATRRRGSIGWVLVEEQPARALGPALAWGRQREVTDLHVLVDDHAGLLARRAEAFVVPPSVWLITGAELEPAHPVEVADPVVPPAAAMAAAELMREHGLEVVVDHGEVVGEILGLEVARVIVDEQGDAHVEAGVGRHDREAFAMMNEGVAPADALASVIATVTQHRRADAEPHPLNRLAAPRWLRSVLVAEPARVGAVELYPVEGVLPRVTVKDSSPAAAVGVDEGGEPVVVVASTGIDLDLVPTAADLRTTYAPDARLVLVVPERDAHPVTHALAAALDHPAEVVGLPGDWRRSAT